MKNTPEQNAREIIVMLDNYKSMVLRNTLCGCDECTNKAVQHVERIQYHIDGLNGDLNKPAKSKAVQAHELLLEFKPEDLDELQLLMMEEVVKEALRNV